MLLSHLWLQTWGLSIDHLRARGVFRMGDVGPLRPLVRPLSELAPRGAVVSRVFELCLTGEAVKGAAELRVAHAVPLDSPLPKKPRAKGLAPAASDTGIDSEGSCEEEAVAAEKMSDISSESSGCSVDTDVDSELEADVKREAARLNTKLSERIHELSALALGSASAPGSAAPPEAPRADHSDEDGDPKIRVASGTWNIWEGAWAYMSHKPGYTDIKMHIRGSLCKDDGGGMGRVHPGKALTPAQYGDSLADPWRTKILLRAWALHRARYGDWITQREGRQREAQLQSDGICEGLRRAQGGAPRVPLLDNKAAHRWLLKWVPDEVDRVLERPGRLR